MIARFDDVIIQTVCRLLIPFIQIYGLYVIAHGHGSPGGGFQGGVILGAGLILLCLSYDVETMKKQMSERRNLLFVSLGVIIYSGIGALCMTLGGNYLDYSALHKILLIDPVFARYMGMFGIEVGVGITVMAVMVSIFLDLSAFDENRKEQP